MKYKIGFAGCGSNEKIEVIPVQGSIVCPIDDKERTNLDIIKKIFKRIVFIIH